MRVASIHLPPPKAPCHIAESLCDVAQHCIDAAMGPFVSPLPIIGVTFRNVNHPKLLNTPPPGAKPNVAAARSK